MNTLLQLVLGLLIMFGTMVLVFGIRVGVESARRSRR